MNGYTLDTKPLEFAEALLALMNRTVSLEEATDRLEAWIQVRLRPNP